MSIRTPGCTSDIVALRAPKPLVVLQCKRDQLFPPEGMQHAASKIAAVYAKRGYANRVESRFYDVPHQFNVAMQEDASKRFDGHLKA